MKTNTYPKYFNAELCESVNEQYGKIMLVINNENEEEDLQLELSGNLDCVVGFCAKDLDTNEDVEIDSWWIVSIEPIKSNIIK